MVLVAMAPSAALTACSDGDGDGDGGTNGIQGAALVKPFGQLADQLHAGGDPRLGDRPGENVRLLSCPVLSDDDAVAIVETLGIDHSGRATAEGVKIIDIPIGESVQCRIRLGDTPERIGVWTGTTTLTGGESEQQVDEGATLVDGEAPGLDDDHVFGVDGPERPLAFTWRDEGFYVGLTLPDGYDDADSAARAMGLTVEAVARSLG
jgi:hypothetical protein